MKKRLVFIILAALLILSFSTKTFALLDHKKHLEWKVKKSKDLVKEVEENGFAWVRLYFISIYDLNKDDKIDKDELPPIEQFIKDNEIKNSTTSN